MRGISALLLLYYVAYVVGFAKWFAQDYCDRPLTEGTVIMNAEAIQDTERQISVYRGDEALESGTEYVPGEHLVVDLSDYRGQFVFEVEGGIMADGTCEGRRSVKRRAVVIMPEAGTADVSVWAGWATGQTAVRITQAVLLRAPSLPDANVGKAIFAEKRAIVNEQAKKHIDKLTKAANSKRSVLLGHIEREEKNREKFLNRAKRKIHGHAGAKSPTFDMKKGRKKIKTGLVQMSRFLDDHQVDDDADDVADDDGDDDGKGAEGVSEGLNGGDDDDDDANSGMADASNDKDSPSSGAAFGGVPEESERERSTAKRKRKEAKAAKRPRSMRGRPLVGGENEAEEAMADTADDDEENDADDDRGTGQPYTKLIITLGVAVAFLGLVFVLCRRSQPKRRTV